MKTALLAAFLGLALLAGLAGVAGCSTPNLNVSGPEFIRAVEARPANEQFVLTRDEKAGYCYADRYVLRPTQTVYRFNDRFRTPVANISSERFHDLLHKLLAENGVWQFDAARGRH
jgi:hypothetical protein